MHNVNLLTMTLSLNVACVDAPDTGHKNKHQQSIKARLQRANRLLNYSSVGVLRGLMYCYVTEVFLF